VPDEIQQLVIDVHDVDQRLDRLTSLLESRGYRTRTTRARAGCALHELLGIWTLYAVRDDA